MKSTLLSFTKLFISGTLIFLASCDHGVCRNTNLVLATQSPERTEYQQLIKAHLEKQGPETFKYYVEELRIHGQDTLLLTKIKNDTVCALIALHIDDCVRLSEIKKSKGQGYAGAELIQPKIKALDSLNHVWFFCTDISDLKK